ncbi:MAG TPA: peptidylprolyl isomerase, partial [Roseibacillus sp.]|nr:peptidylprolyl isomerase [Roseibacillus sp.]
TISMARTSAPDSATSQFFINVVDNPSLDPKSAANPQGFSPDGYAVFGKVVEGMDVVDKIKQVDTGVKRLQARGPAGQLVEQPMENVPLQDVVIKKATAGQ